MREALPPTFPAVSDARKGRPAKPSCSPVARLLARHSSPEGSTPRLAHAPRLRIVMLGGGTKGTQSRDVKHAKELARALRIDEENPS